MKHFAVDEKNLPEQNSSVSSTAYHWEIFITGSADRAGAPYCLIYLNKESLYLARSSSFLFQLRSSLYLARSSSFLFQLISFIVLILFSNTSFCYRNTIIDACIFDIRCLSPSSAAKTTNDLPVPYTLANCLNFFENIPASRMSSLQLLAR